MKNAVFSSTSYRNYKRPSDLIATLPLRHRGLTVSTEERVAYQLDLREVCGVFPWRLIDPLSACEPILGRGPGYYKKLSRPWGSSQEAVFLCGLCFASCLQVPALIALHDGLWLGQSIWNNPPFSTVLLVQLFYHNIIAAFAVESRLRQALHVLTNSFLWVGDYFILQYLTDSVR